MAQEWKQMSSEEKMNMLTAILAAAASDLSIRDRLLESPEAALAAVRELNEKQGKPVDFPPEFSIRFVSPHQTSKATTTVLMKVPPYYPNAAPPIPLEEHLLCTYFYWKDRDDAPPRP